MFSKRTKQNAYGQIDDEAVLEGCSGLFPVPLREEPADNRGQSIRESHPENKCQIEEVVDKRGGCQFLGVMMAYHDIVGKIYHNNP